MSMMMNAMVALNWHHDDPEQARKEILAAAGDMSWLQLFGSQVLLGDYMRPVTTRGGIITRNAEQMEDVFQGTVGMILAIGPQAWRGGYNEPMPAQKAADAPMPTRWVPGDEERFGGALPEIGDFVYCRPQDTVMAAIKGPGSRMLPDGNGRTREFQGWPAKIVYARDIYARVMLPHAIL